MARGIRYKPTYNHSVYLGEQNNDSDYPDYRNYQDFQSYSDFQNYPFFEIPEIPIQGYIRQYAPDSQIVEPETSSSTTKTSEKSSQKSNASKTEVKAETSFLPEQHDTFGQQFEASNVQQKDKYREYFRKMAKRESGMNPTISRKDNSATGYFQFLPRNIRAFYKGTNFKNDPIGQIEAMEKFTDANLKSLSTNDLAKAEEKGYSMSALAAGMHLGGLGGVRKVLNGVGNPKDANGTSVAKYMNEFNGLFKQGGILKRK